MKLNTDIQVTFNPKDKVCEINIVMESTTSKAYKLSMDIFMINQRISFVISLYHPIHRFQYIYVNISVCHVVILSLEKSLTKP